MFKTHFLVGSVNQNNRFISLLYLNFIFTSHWDICACAFTEPYGWTPKHQCWHYTLAARWCLICPVHFVGCNHEAMLSLCCDNNVCVRSVVDQVLRNAHVTDMVLYGAWFYITCGIHYINVRDVLNCYQWFQLC